MGAIAVLVEGRSLPPWLGRFPRSQTRFERCRSLADLERTLQTRFIELILLDPKTAAEIDLAVLRWRYPGIPVAIISRLRAEDAGQLLRWDEFDVALVLVEGIDDPVAGDLLIRQTVSHRRLAALAEFPRLLRLTEPLQLLAWDRLGAWVGCPPGPAELARILGVSREHLSRQFAAGGAPTLKQVGDLLRVIITLSLLQNPGYDTGAVARLLGFATPSHLHTVVRRVTGTRLGEVRALGAREVLRRFLQLRRSGGQPVGRSEARGSKGRTLNA